MGNQESRHVSFAPGTFEFDGPHRPESIWLAVLKAMQKLRGAARRAERAKRVAARQLDAGQLAPVGQPAPNPNPTDLPLGEAIIYTLLAAGALLLIWWFF